MVKLEFPDKEEELLGVVRHDFQHSASYHTLHQLKINEYAHAYNASLYGNEQAHKSQIVAPITKEFIDYQVPGLKSPFLSLNKLLKGSGTLKDTDKLAVMFEKYLNYVYYKQFNPEPFIDKLVKTLLLQGTVIVKLGWDYRTHNRFTAIHTKRIVVEPIPENEQTLQQAVTGQKGNPVEKETTEVKKDIKYTINQPTAEVILHEEIFVAPNALNGDISEADFVIHTYKTNISKLRESGVYANLDKVSSDLLGAVGNTSMGNDTNPYNINMPGYVIPSRVHMSYSDIERQLITIREYWGYYDIDKDGVVEPILCVVANDSVVIRLELNPYPDGRLPFVSTSINKGIYDLYGSSDAELLSITQRQLTTLWRGAFDNLMVANNGQKGYPINFFRSSKERNAKEQGEDYEYDPRAGGGIIQETFNELPGSFYNLIGKLKEDASYVIGVTPQLGNQAGNASMYAPGSAMSSAQLRQLDIVKNIALNLILPMLRRWGLYASEFLSPEEWARIVGRENVMEIPEDTELYNLVELDMEISTEELKQLKMNSLSFVFQTVGPSMPPELQQLVQADIFELAGMYGRADFMRSYKPEPDPAQQKMQELQLLHMQKEIEGMDSDIKLATSKIQENEADIKRKIGDAAFKESQTNIAKADFINKIQGKPQQLDFGKHLSALSSKERIQENKSKLKAFESQLKYDLERNKQEFMFKQSKLLAQKFKEDTLNKRLKIEQDFATKNNKIIADDKHRIQKHQDDLLFKYDALLETKNKNAQQLDSKYDKIIDSLSKGNNSW